MKLALYEPDIPQNTGNMIRLCACMGVEIHIIEPCGFPFSVKAMRRAGMDYVDHAKITRHNDWSAFEDWRKEQGLRLILLSSKAVDTYTDFKYSSNDILMMGRESAGVPADVANSADALLTIPMAEGLRSLNVSTTAAMVVGEALRQTNSFPKRGQN